MIMTKDEMRKLAAQAALSKPIQKIEQGVRAIPLTDNQWFRMGHKTKEEREGYLNNPSEEMKYENKREQELLRVIEG